MKKQILCILGICAAFLTHAQMPAKENVSRLTSFEYSDVYTADNVSKDAFTNTYEYNEYGFASVVNHDVNGWLTKTQYSYTWERPGVWNTCTDSDGTTITRTFHPNGSVATNITKDASGEIKSSYEYDDQGKLTAGTIYRTPYSYMLYFTHLNYWFICTEYDVYQIDPSGNSYKHIVYNKDEEKTLSSVEEEWYTPSGFCISNFQESYKDGKLSDYSGRKVSYEGDKIILTSYKLVDDSGPALKAYLKDVYSANYFNSYISNPVHEPNEIYTCDFYRISEDGQETLGGSQIRSWVTQNILKTASYTDGNLNYQPIYILYQNGRQYIVYYDETSRCYGYDEEEYTLESALDVTGAADERIYRHFDEDDNSLWTIKNHDEIYWSQQDPQTGEWIPCTGTITIFDARSGNSQDRSIKIELDNQSRISNSIQIYPNTKLIERTVYTYTADGYEYTVYDNAMSGTDDTYRTIKHFIKSSSNGITTEIIEQEYRITWPQYQKIEYNYNNKIITEYGKDNNNDDWSLRYRRGMTTIEYLPDGNTYALTRRTVEGDAAVYYTKRIGTINPVDDVTTYTEYSWNKDTNDWEPRTKVEILYAPIDVPDNSIYIDIYLPDLPENNLYDYFRPSVLSPYTYLYNHKQNNTVFSTYSWNKDTKAWDLSNKEGSTYDIEGGNAKLVSYKFYDTYTYIINAAGILLSETHSNVNDGITYQADYTLDSEGRLTKRVIADQSKIKSSTYTYSEIEILSELKEIGTEGKLVFTGTAVEADSYIRLFTVAGNLVAAADGSIDTTSLTPGIYIARTANATLKIAIK